MKTLTDSVTSIVLSRAAPFSGAGQQDRQIACEYGGNPHADCQTDHDAQQMHAQCFDVFPETGARLCFGGEAREGIEQRTIFRRFLVEKTVRSGARARNGKAIMLKSRTNGNLMTRQSVLKEFSHFVSFRH